MEKKNQLKSCCKKMLSSRQAVGRDLPLSMLLIKEEKQPCLIRQVEDPRQKPSGMTNFFYNSCNAFTLIELLVVVLIIGILAAVALPQYQKAVERSKATQAWTMLQSIMQAAATYYLANGKEITSFDELDIDIPWPSSTRVVGLSQETRSNGQWALERESPSSGDTVLYMTRLTGKYKGAGFAIALRGINTPVKTCIERKSGSTITFDTSLAAGAYCLQIMKAGNRINENAFGRDYRWP